VKLQVREVPKKEVHSGETFPLLGKKARLSPGRYLGDASLPTWPRSTPRGPKKQRKEKYSHVKFLEARINTRPKPPRRRDFAREFAKDGRG